MTKTKRMIRWNARFSAAELAHLVSMRNVHRGRYEVKPLAYFRTGLKLWP